MSIVAYASSNVAPILFPNEDYDYDLSVISLGGPAALFGDAEDSLDPLAVWTWSWTLMSSMPGSAAAIDVSTNQNINVAPIDIWGNVRLFLVATNTNTGLSSESDPLRAPSSAFVIIRVMSVDKGLQKIAAGERNWYDDQWDLVQAVEDINLATAHNIIDHTDVALATGPDLDALTQGAYPLDPDGANPLNDEGFRPLHKHYGSSVNPATTTTRGTVQLASAWLGGGDPEVLVKQYVQYTGQIYHSNIDGGISTFILPHGNGFNAIDFKKMLPAHILWHVPADSFVKHWDVCLMSVNRWDGPGVYKFGLILFTSLANIHNNVYSLIPGSSVPFGAPTVVDGPIAKQRAVAQDITGPCWVGVQVVEAPDTEPEYGFGLQATMTTEV